MRRQGRKQSTGANVPAFAKIACPSVVSVYNRVRLFRLLDRARKTPVVWISAPGGAGKTTLVTSYLQARRLPVLWYQMDAGDNDVASFFYYLGLAAKAAAPECRDPLPLLTSEYLAGISTFTINYFRELFGRLKRPCVVVFDNYQDVDPEGEIQKILEWGLEQIPAGINVVVLSRQLPPGVFVRLRVVERIAFVGWEDLKLTEEESGAIVKLRRKQTQVSREAISRLHQDTQGWVAGLVLLTEQSAEVAAQQPHPAEFASQSIFDYFANEIFRRTSPVTQQFLLRTSFLPKISATTAQRLVQESDSEAILRDLTGRNYFTVRHVDGSYEYHPLFRAFLANRANAILAAEQIRNLKQHSAELLVEAGDVETAVALLQQAQDWTRAMELILRHASTLFVQGRTQTLEAWLKTFPESLRVQDPWALYWLGTCRLSYAPAEARTFLERAFALFEKETDAAPLYLAWSRIIDSFLLELNDLTPMIEWLDRYPTLKNNRVPPPAKIENASIFIYVAGLTNARFDHPDMEVYAERAERLFQEEANMDRRLACAANLIPYYFWTGDETKARTMLDQFTSPTAMSKASLFARLNWYTWKAMHAATVGAADDARRAVTEGLALADMSGIHLLDLRLFSLGVWSELCAGNVPAARRFVQRIASLEYRGRANDAMYLHYVSMVALHEGDTARAVDEARRAVDLARAGGFAIGLVAYLACLGYAYIRQGDTDTALAVLAEARSKAVAMRSKFFLQSCDFCEAMARRLRGEQAQAIEALRNGLRLASETGMMRRVWWLNEDTVALYAMALDENIQPDYVRGAIERMRLSPPQGRMPENWPSPQI